jgi:diguanylate cyclase (GGDEF)-like protein
MIESSGIAEQESRQSESAPNVGVVCRVPDPGATDRAREDLRSINAWYLALQSQLKRLIRTLSEKSHTAAAPGVDHGHGGRLRRSQLSRSQLSRELDALRLFVTAMQTELRGARSREEEARYLSLHDDLTGLPNRRHFLDRLNVALRGNTPGSLDLAVIYLDLDGFKDLNDLHGHAAGDHLLKLVAARLGHAIRAGDIVSRLGGDEYACLITGVAQRARLQEIALALFAAVSTPFQVGDVMLTVNLSIGIAVYPFDGTTSEALMKSADGAMYVAKRTRCGPSFAHPHRPLSLQ